MNVLPVGGWQNVLKLQIELINNNVLGVGKRVFSILDGDIQTSISKEFRPIKKLFLPINSVEKYLINVLLLSPVLAVKKRINDVFFSVETVDELLRQYQVNERHNATALGKDYKPDNDGKRLYSLILKNVQKRKITEDAFISGLYSIVRENVDFSSFYASLLKELGA